MCCKMCRNKCDFIKLFLNKNVLTSNLPSLTPVAVLSIGFLEPVKYVGPCAGASSAGFSFHRYLFPDLPRGLLSLTPSSEPVEAY